MGKKVDLGRFGLRKLPEQTGDAPNDRHELV